jgi:hypothetical protein
MSAYDLLDVVRIEHEDRIRKAERDRLFVSARQANKRPSAFKAWLLALLRG